MNDIRTFTIDEFNKQMQQPTLHPEVAVIDPARLEDDGTLCFTGNFYAIRFVQTRCGEARYGRKCADFQYGTLVFTKPGDIVRVCREDAVDGSISGILFHPELFSTKSLVFKKTDYTFFDYRENESLHLSLQEKRIVQDRLEHLTRNCGAILTATAYALYLPGWNCCWTTAFVSMNGNLPAAPTLTGNIWRSWTKRFPNIFHYADKSLWKAV